MSKDLRHEKNCLNCGHEVPERFCTHCGQENTPAHEPFGHLLKHFAADVVHYDSKFHTSIAYLLFRPGRLTKEYLAGKRVSYIHPIRLYIFVSFVFFFTAFAINKHEEVEGEKATQHALLQSATDTLSHVLKGVQLDSEDGKPGTNVADYTSRITHTSLDSTFASRSDSKGWEQFHSVAAYDSAQKTLPDSLRDGKGERWLYRRLIYLRHKYNNANYQEIFMEMIQHDGPKVMFLLLPLFALLMKAMYNWKRWFYADHAIFSIHVHSFWFILFLVVLILGRIFNTDVFNGWGWMLGFFYLMAAMRNTYSQGWGKSFIKASVISVAYCCSVLIVFLLFLLLAFAVIL